MRFLYSLMLFSLLLPVAHVQASGHAVPDIVQSNLPAERIAAEPPAQPQNQVSALTAQQVRAFLDRFVDPSKTPEEQAAFFTDRVEYYDHGIVGKKAIRRDVERFVRHWPYRSYRVAEIDYIHPDPESERLFVSYSIDFEVANKSKAIRGRASYGALISGLGDAPKIEPIQERVTKRRANTPNTLNTRRLN
jgi:hypothetical protein